MTQSQLAVSRRGYISTFGQYAIVRHVRHLPRVLSRVLEKSNFLHVENGPKESRSGNLYFSCFSHRRKPSATVKFRLPIQREAEKTQRGRNEICPFRNRRTLCQIEGIEGRFGAVIC
jgi:hypothetical protein